MLRLSIDLLEVKIDVVLAKIAVTHRVPWEPRDGRGSSYFFGIGIFPVSEIGSVLVFLVSFVSPFFVSFPPFSLKKGAELLKKGAIAPLLRKKGGHCPLLDTELYRPSFPTVLVW
jgi:hypothetical protein